MADARDRVVLDDEILEVRKPHRAVRPDFSEDRRHPLIRARDQIEAIVRDIACPVLADIHQGDQLHGWLGDQGHPLHPGWQLITVDERTPRRSGVGTHPINLAVVRGDRMSQIYQIDLLGRHAAHPFRKSRLGNASVKNWRSVGCPTELISPLVMRLRPGVVGELMKELEL